MDVVAKSLKKHGYDAAPIHGDLDQSQRTRTLDGFRAGDLKILVASDVAARGLDVPSVSHVLNYDVPSHAEDYVHRIGRTGRAGREGKTMMICAPRDEKNLEDIERLIQKPVPRIPDPTARGGAAPETASTPEADTPEAKSDDKPASRSRSRSRASKKPKDAPAPQAVEPAVEAESQPAEKPAAEKPAAEKPAAQSRGGKSGNRGGASQNSNRGGKPVVGMGDHMPSFIALSFEDRRTG